jgi:outer membrane protein OmpA-like peptidoglycan-associated protein
MVDFAIRLLLNDGIENWKLELKDETGFVQRSFSGLSSVPSVIGWNGLDEQGQIREALYTPELTVNYTRGDVVKAKATNVLVDISGPVLTVVTTPEYFSPDNDGENDELFINLTAKDASPIASWSFEIRTPVESGTTQVFRVIEGRGSPSSRIIWDGKSDKGELVQSAMYYPYTFSATDALGNSSSVQGRIGIDVLVIREGDRLRIQIPSIQFRPNFADFDGLPMEVVDNNMRIIRRIAQILNQFRDYKVQVEGHANPTQPAGSAREREEPELKRISEARAKAIVEQLVRNGVARNRLTAIGAGSSKTIAAFEDRDNWWKNRRVEFYLIK